MTTSMNKRLSLTEEIEAAESAEEIQQLLAKGETYFAGQRTKQRWHSRARRRLSQLRNLNGGSK